MSDTIRLHGALVAQLRREAQAQETTVEELLGYLLQLARNEGRRRTDRLPGDASFDDARERARAGLTWFNTALFVQPPDFTLGAGARNFSDVRRDGYRNVDLSLLKNFVFGEGRQKLQFRGEFINAFNLVVFGTPGANVSDPANFGKITTQGKTPRLIQAVLRYTF